MFQIQTFFWNAFFLSLILTGYRRKIRFTNKLKGDGFDVGGIILIDKYFIH
jgi:hypothetical protein